MMMMLMVAVLYVVLCWCGCERDVLLAVWMSCDQCCVRMCGKPKFGSHSVFKN